jgi:hypothetical protein
MQATFFALQVELIGFAGFVNNNQTFVGPQDEHMSCKHPYLAAFFH